MDLYERLLEIGQILVVFVSSRVEKILSEWERASEEEYTRVQGEAVFIIQGLRASDGVIENSTENLLSIQSKTKKHIFPFLEKAALDGAAIIEKAGKQAVKEIGAKAEALYRDTFEEAGEEYPPGVMEATEEDLEEIIGKSVYTWLDQHEKIKSDVLSSLQNVSRQSETQEKAIERYRDYLPSIDKQKLGGGRFRVSLSERLKMTLEVEMVRAFAELSDREATRLGGLLNDFMLVQNINPLDKRTCEYCEAATLEGPMTIFELRLNYGEPPRHPRCRCYVLDIPGRYVP